jgi:hypothetical protein
MYEALRDGFIKFAFLSQLRFSSTALMNCAESETDNKEEAEKHGLELGGGWMISDRVDSAWLKGLICEHPPLIRQVCHFVECLSLTTVFLRISAFTRDSAGSVFAQ